eukprot:TRINITY_DN3064_c0_g1_i1.p1 TRINITY_DN3064_c0_g1~~TRINITY_DN3064_c0_g1_i1.p1  ORF type:complete len:534 (+),score=125.93 TRINITY_DN3064_c0_g1_i1:170-1603(+)
MEGATCGLALSVFLILALNLSLCSAYFGTKDPLRIDCGASSPSIENGLYWQADKYFDAGYPSNISDIVASLHGLQAAENTSRVFLDRVRGCYHVPRPIGRYLIRLGFVYLNFDGYNNPPIFDIYLQDALVEMIDMGAVEVATPAAPYYSDFIVYAPEGEVSICFQQIVGAPFVSSIEVLPADTEAYDGSILGRNIILSNYLRVNFGGYGFGPEPVDPGFRTWSGDDPADNFEFSDLTTNHSIEGVGEAPDYLPERVFQSARQALPPGNVTSYRFAVVPLEYHNKWFLRLYLAEIEEGVKDGERVFDVRLGGSMMKKPLVFDILHNTTAFHATVVSVLFNYSDYAVTVGEEIEIGVEMVAGGSVKPPIMNGAELFEILIAPGQLQNHTYEGGSGLSVASLTGYVLGSLFGLVLLLVFCGCCAFCLFRRNRYAHNSVSGNGPFAPASANAGMSYEKSQGGEFVGDDIDLDKDLEMTVHN